METDERTIEELLAAEVVATRAMLAADRAYSEALAATKAGWVRDREREGLATEPFTLQRIQR